MSEGLLYSNFRIRSLVPRALVWILKLDVEIQDPYQVDEKFTKDFPLRKLPSFLGPHGYKLTEQMAINNYLIKLSKDEKIKAQLLGAEDDIKTQSQILRWESLANSDLIATMVKVFGPLKGDAPYIKKNVDDASNFLEEIVGIYEARLRDYTYLASESISLADLVSAAIFIRGFNFIFGEQWRKEHPAIVRWFKTVIESPFLAEETKDFKFIEKPLEPPQGKKKEQPKQQAKQQPAQKAPAAQQPPQEKKPKHPLELLGKSSFPLEDWKRKYMNDDTRPTALPWFWEHYNPEEWSLWKVEYRYNDELTLTFMSNNLIGGFFTRLFGSVKYMFGSMVVYGENNDNGIVGAIMIRGQDYVKAFDVAPDWESYKFTQLDATKPEDKAFVEDMWAWDKPVIVNGKPREIVDGKVLK
ncbi:ZYRO0F08448p [Zygosaccharomyces rouxii]|uniref:ZYRO0F08448p n=1 Tax=Zygosaccharomyces rouxii (strain ATCC 2623 / CBS 732 / NBRC 1130 / NCYC 568 / NRRL Y-229) TaxID=559307 RepID=C5DXX1_ZYGRC|nr:elongation factor 1 gamma domain-containing protein [Zygosaccharomyces rouxii]KAH9199389.1 hypothetical protein LQ764DRAFT_197387 [Zygosaccharomyces rouxii]CAR28632.1 ZYRO0F08448p [Zygosaccharomyces rouxii]